jgi:hypothetical protein
MAGPRLTGLEFHWFGRGQLLASRYCWGAAMELGPSVAVLMADIVADAQASSDGPTSLRRVADRFVLDADAIQSEDAKPSPALPRLDTDRQIMALRCLAAAFETAATEITKPHRRLAH